MDVSELMIGNVTSHGIVYKIEQETDPDFKDQIGCMDHLGGIGVFDNEEISPCKLTVDILVNLGFETSDKPDFSFLLKISASKLYVRENGDHLFFSFNDTYLGEIFPNIHQLQNFCKILGKELTLVNNT